MSEGKYQPEYPKYATRCTFSHPWLELSRQVRHKSILITPLCHSRCVLCAECKKYMQEVMQVAHIHLLLFFYLSLSPYLICVQFTSMWKGPRVFKPSRQELRPPPTNAFCDWGFPTAINLHYGPVSSCLAAANSNRLRQLLLTASLMAANERHLTAVDPCAQRGYAVAQSQQLNMGPVSFSISHQSTVASSILTKCCPGTESNHWGLDCFEFL